jgi:hypothetical protein
VKGTVIMFVNVKATEPSFISYQVRNVGAEISG